MYYIDLAVTGISFGCMYAMMSVGLTLVYGLLRILHVAHAAVFALGAYVTVLVANATGSIALGFVAAILVTPLFGMAIYRLLYQPLLKYRPDVPMIASVGLLVLMQDAFRIAVRRAGRHLSPQCVLLHDIQLRRHHRQRGADRHRDHRRAGVRRPAPVHDPDADRRRLARHGFEAADRRQLRRRPDQGALPQLRDRLGAGGGGRRAGRAAEQSGRSDRSVSSSATRRSRSSCSAGSAACAAR